MMQHAMIDSDTDDVTTHTTFTAHVQKMDAKQQKKSSNSSPTVYTSYKKASIA
jgi:hypothetical protein